MASVKLRLNKNRMDARGTYALVFQIIHERRKKVVYTGLRMTESDFDVGAEKIITGGASGFREEEVRSMHRKLNRQRKEFETRIKQLEHEWGAYTVHDIGPQGKRKPCDRLLHSLGMQIIRKEKEGHPGMAAAYKSTRASVARFLNDRDIDISAINVRFIREYEHYLKAGGLSANTIAYYLRNLRTIYNAAGVACNRKESYPFRHIRTSQGKTRKRALDRDELVRLAETSFDSHDKHIEFARDFFLFSFYTRGMSLVDIIYLKKNSVENGIITYQRQKSKQILHVSVTDPLQKLMDKYANDTPYVLPILDETSSKSIYYQYRLALTRINRNLNLLGRRLNIQGPLTTYVARHSWATQAKEMGTPVSVISEGMGHSSERITQIYLKEFDRSVIDKINEKIVRLI